MRSKRSRCARSLSIVPRLLELESRDVPTFYGNQLFPLDNPWNQIIANAPVASNSASIINRIVSRHSGNTQLLHPDFGNPTTDGALYGIPINVANSLTPRYTITFPSPPNGYKDESDVVQVPIPANAVIEGDGPTGPSDPAQPSARGDSHLLVYDSDANVLYELGAAARPDEASYPYGGSKPLGVWGAWQVSYWDLNTNAFRTIEATSADAAGLPIMLGLVRPDEALPVAEGGQGVITHAIRMTLDETRDSFIFPASHEASNLTGTDVARMGDRFRLKSSFVIPSSWSPETQAIAQAMKDYGLIVADNGSDMFFQGTPSDQWDMDAILRIHSIPVTQFDVVDLTPVVTGLNVNAGLPTGGTPVTITGHNFSGAAGELHVFFGATEATSITILSDSQVLAIAPAHAAGTVDIQVQSGSMRQNTDNQSVFFGYGTSDPSSADQFTFSPTAPPPPPPPPSSPPPPPPPAPAAQPFAIGSVPGQVATVTLYNPDRSVRFTVQPFGGSYKGGVRVAVGDVTGDGVPDVVAVTAGGIAAQAQIIDGATQTMLSTQLLGTTSYTGKVSVAVGDVTGDGIDDIAVGTNQGGPRAQVFRGGDFLKLADVVAGPSANFLGRTFVALADMDHDTKADLVVTGLYSGGTRFAGYNANSLAPTLAPQRLFNAFTLGGGYVNGLFLAVGDMNSDGFADLVLGRVSARNITVYSGSDLVQSNIRKKLAAFAPAGGLSTSPVRVGLEDVDGDGQLDILTSVGEMVTAYKGGSGLPLTGSPPQLFSLDLYPSVKGSVWVG